MTEEEVLALPIETISEQVLSSGPIHVYFSIENHRYFIKVLCMPNDLYIVVSVKHDDDMHTICPFCHQNIYKTCIALNKHTFALFQQLIQHNTIRLPWLYRTYEKA